MKKCAWFGLVVAVAFVFTASEVHARGGRGGGRPGGGRPAGGHVGGGQFNGGQFGGGQFGGGQIGQGKPGSGVIRNGAGAGQFGNAAGNFGNKLQAANQGSRVGAAQNKASQLHANFASRNEPFSPAWYADHPGAWQYTHPHADAWAVATVAGAAAWLGYGAAYPAYEDSTVLTSDVEDGTYDQNAEQTSSEPLDAAELAARGNVDLPSDTEFMPLGVYALAPSGQNDASAVVQLSVTRDGILRGSYCDLVTDQGQTVYGAIDKPSQRVAWTVGRGGRTVFETMLPTLTQSEGAVAVSFPGGNTRQWTLARYEDASGQSD